MKAKFYLVVCICILLGFNTLFGQKNEKLNKYLEMFNIQYSMPNGYLESDSSLVIYNKSGYRVGRSVYKLIAQKDSIVILFRFNGPIDTSKNLTGFIGVDGKQFDPNKNYRPSKTEYTTFSNSYTTKIYNADVSGTYDLQVSEKNHILNSGEKCKVIFIHKDNKVDIELFYFYNKSSEPQLNKHLKRTRKMLRFKN
ncbi:hypothetical protein [Pedobacter steynii]